jgi:hypothetical protein
MTDKEPEITLVPVPRKSCPVCWGKGYIKMKSVKQIVRVTESGAVQERIDKKADFKTVPCKCVKWKKEADNAIQVGCPEKVLPLGRSEESRDNQETSHGMGQVQQGPESTKEGI